MFTMIYCGGQLLFPREGRSRLPCPPHYIRPCPKRQLWDSNRLQSKPEGDHTLICLSLHTVYGYSWTELEMALNLDWILGWAQNTLEGLCIPVCPKKCLRISRENLRGGNGWEDSQLCLIS